MLHKLSPAFLQNIHCVIVVLTPLSMLNVSVADIHEGIASFWLINNIQTLPTYYNIQWHTKRDKSMTSQQTKALWLSCLDVIVLLEVSE